MDLLKQNELTDRLDRLSAVVVGPFEPSSLVGSFFHNEGGWQGCVVAEVAPQVFLVELFEWILGSSSAQRLVHIHKMMDWDFYDSADWMRTSVSLSPSSGKNLDDGLSR